MQHTPMKLSSSTIFSPYLDNEEAIIPILKGSDEATMEKAKWFLERLHTNTFHSTHPDMKLLSNNEIKKIFEKARTNNSDTIIMHEQDQYDLPSLKQYLITDMIKKIDKSIECWTDKDSRTAQGLALQSAQHVVQFDELFRTEYSEWMERSMNTEMTWDNFKNYWNGLCQEW